MHFIFFYLEDYHLSSHRLFFFIEKEKTLINLTKINTCKFEVNDRSRFLEHLLVASIIGFLIIL